MFFIKLFLAFIIYAFIGWILEIIYTYIRTKKVINRGFLIGPYCPIYGMGCILITLLLKKYYDDPIVLAIMSMIICSLLEYITSYAMEKVFKARWWDYRDRKFNINGRICLETLVPFGIGSLVIMYVVNPFIVNLLNIIPEIIIYILFISIFVMFVLDIIISFNAISKIRISSKKILEDSTEEITKHVKKYLLNNFKQWKRISKSFPDLKIKCHGRPVFSLPDQAFLQRNPHQ